MLPVKSFMSHTTLCNIMCQPIWEVLAMATNLRIDDKLIVKAVKLGAQKTKKAAVTQALRE